MFEQTVLIDPRSIHQVPSLFSGNPSIAPLNNQDFGQVCGASCSPAQGRFPVFGFESPSWVRVLLVSLGLQDSVSKLGAPVSFKVVYMHGNYTLYDTVS